jgi:ribonuclease HII
MLVGIDEVGRGCWAGPVTAGAVILKPRHTLAELKDSKQLTRLQREQLAVQIRAQAVAFGIGWADPAEVDTHGLTMAVRLAMERALAAITLPYREIVIDGSFNFLKGNPKARALVKADGFLSCVSAASILAKVARDQFMRDIAGQFPGYGFENHVGYGVRAHEAALRELGVCKLHRRSFKPVQALLA